MTRLLSSFPHSMVLGLEPEPELYPPVNRTKKLVLLLMLCLFCCCAQCRENNIIEDRSPPHSRSRTSSFQRIIFSIFLGIMAGLAFSLLFAFLVRWFVRYINRTPILKGPVVFSPKIPPKTLQLALSNGTTQILGSSPNGRYFKAVLDNGLTIAVKRLEPFDGGSRSPDAQSKSAKGRIQEELEMLANLRHRNLMSLRAYIRELDRFCLVYDYVPSGSLEDAMWRVRDNQLKLGWEIRLKIAVGIVTGLQYLHFSCNARVLHGNLKPTNVMLDAEYEPRLADCGLANIIPNFNRASSAYSAPECVQNCRYTDKSDVFSFGVILAVLLTGKNPVDPFFGESSGGGSLEQWLRRLQQAGEALDKSILGQEAAEEEMLMAVKIAVVCLSDLPADRPSSDELVSMLTQLNSF